jgi:hypothetical protein
LNNNASELCIKPKNRTWYITEFKNGRCLARKELQFDQLSKFQLKGGERLKRRSILSLIGINKNPTQRSIDRKIGQILGELVIYHWNHGWLSNFLTYGMGGSHCKFKNKPNIYRDTLELTLKPVKRRK